MDDPMFMFWGPLMIDLSGIYHCLIRWYVEKSGFSLILVAWPWLVRQCSGLGSIIDRCVAFVAWWSKAILFRRGSTLPTALEPFINFFLSSDPVYRTSSASFVVGIVQHSLHLSVRVCVQTGGFHVKSQYRLQVWLVLRISCSLWTRVCCNFNRPNDSTSNDSESLLK